MEEKRIHKTSVGGQALIEGVMMQGPRGIATAVRKTDGDIVVKHHEFSHIRDKHKFFGLPIIRGMVNFVESMILGYKMLMYSAEASGMEDLEDVEMNKFEKWLTDKLGDKFMNIIMGIATVLGFALAFVIFFYLPVLAFSKLNSACSNALTPWQGTIEGVMKILIFVIYIAIVSQMKDIKRTFMYHGAEHIALSVYKKFKKCRVKSIDRLQQSVVIISNVSQIIAHRRHPCKGSAEQEKGGIHHGNFDRVLFPGRGELFWWCVPPYSSG